MREWDRCRQRVVYDAVLREFGVRSVGYDDGALADEFVRLSECGSGHRAMRGFSRNVDALAVQLRELGRG